jgi:hypothetical protein
MVTTGRIALSAVGLLLSLAAAAEITQDDYNKALGYGEEKIDYSDTLTPHDKIHTLIPEPEKPKQTGQADGEVTLKTFPLDGAGSDQGGASSDAATSTAAPGADAAAPSAPPVASSQAKTQAVGEKEGQSAAKKNPTPTSASAGIGGTGGKSGAGKNGTYLYFSPSLAASADGVQQSNQSQIEMPEQQVITFGIPIGSQIRVTMDKSATNIQPGYVMLVVEETVRGQLRVLARGTKLFARISTGIGAERLYLTAVKGLVLGELTEFDMTGEVYATDGKPGLPAVVLNDGKTLDRATTTVTDSLAKGVINAVASGDIVTAAGQAGAEAVTDEKTQDRETKTGQPLYIVQASPQKAVLRIEKTF